MGLTGKSHATMSLRHHVTALVSHLPCPCHQTSQSFALPPATKPVSHLTCPLPPCHRVTTSVSHLPCPLPPNQSVICLVLYHHITTSLHHCVTTSLHHCISQSFAFPPDTKPVSHLPCPLPPNQSVI